MAATVAFAVNGAMPATLLARYAEVRSALDVSTGLFGILIAALTVGAALTFSVPGVLLRRFGSRTIAVSGTVATTFAFVLAGVGVMTGNVWLFALGLLVAGFCDSTVDVAQNAQGLRVQAALGKSVLTSMHAGWSVGAAVGGAVGTLAATLGVPLVVHLVIWAIVCSAAMALAGSQFLPVHRGEDEEAPGRIPASVWKYLVPILLVAIAGILVEDIGNNWSAVLLNTERGVDAAQSGVALTTLLSAQFVGRLFGDAAIDRFGRRPTLIASLVGILASLNLIAWATEPWLTLLGFALAGVSCAVTVPLAYSLADGIPGMRAHSGVTLLAWIMRVATIGLTPAIGGISALTSLPAAISLMSLLAAAALAAMLWRPKKS
ncbi:MFS transporter [Gulosibacter molinativorax]|uniref:MFS transporter n=1 Tax=Gulosibacter molinativorax TaxID=256821 RepID=A0ABT7C5I7_9MICO|nr:MFS transporter [Gulosibacter molinativorax]